MIYKQTGIRNESTTVSWQNGGMPLNHLYTPSFYTEGIKWYSNTGELYLATSTAESNRHTSAIGARMELWRIPDQQRGFVNEAP